LSGLHTFVFLNALEIRGNRRVRFQIETNVLGPAEYDVSIEISNGQTVTEDELLFVSDDFSSSSHRYEVSDARTLYDSFVHHMSQCGYGVTDMSSSEGLPEPGAKTVYVHRGSVMNLDKGLLARWKVPQFRFMSVDSASDMNSAVSLSSFIVASCLLRNGGLLVIDGIDSHDFEQFVSNQLSHYFKIVQEDRVVMVPLMSARNKLYLTTLDYRQRYTEYITSQHGKSGLEGKITEVTTSIYGKEFTYLLLE